MKKPVKVSYQEKVTRGEGTSYVIDNYITSEISNNVSLAVSHLKGELWGTKNIVSDRIYYIIQGKAYFTFEDGSEFDINQGDVFYIPSDTVYKMIGEFDAVLINSPAFDLDKEERVDL